MATLFKRNGIWYVNYIDLTGRRIKRSLGTKDRKLAELKLKEIELELAKGKLGFALDLPLGEFIEKYLEWSNITKALSTYKTDVKACKDLIDYFGLKIKLSRIKLSKLEGWKIWLVDYKGYSKVTANVRIRHVKAMFNKAVEWQYLENSPAEKLKQYKVPKGKPDFLTEEEVKKLFSVIEDRTHLAVFNLLYFTGMRLSEAVNLRWKDVNFEEGYIRIKSSKNFHTKNYRERHIPIHKKLYEHLYHLKNVSPEKVVPFKYRYIQQLFQKYSQKAGIKATPHILRHSIATAMASKGVSLQAIKEILGHSDYSTTLIYAKMTDDYKKKALEVVFKDEN